MEGWYYILILIFSILFVGRSIFNFVLKLFSAEPTEYILTKEENILLGITISYILTYIIY
jgi:hypothetical protein